MHAASVVFGQAVTANLNAAVQFRINFKLEFQLKIAPILFGTEKRVGGVRDTGTYDRALFHTIGRLASPLLPPFERFSIEQLDPLGKETGRKKNAK